MRAGTRPRRADMAAEATTEAVNELRLDIQRLTQGLHNMLDRFERQETILLQILDCVAVEPSDEEESPLTVTLKQLIVAVQRLPDEITRAVAAGMREAGVTAATR